jgi:hypothetical protein
MQWKVEGVYIPTLHMYIVAGWGETFRYPDIQIQNSNTSQSVC